MSVLVVVTNAEEAGALIRWGARFAHARDTTLAVLQLARAPKPQAVTQLQLEDPSDEHPVRVAIRAVGGGEVVRGLTTRFERRRTQRLERLRLEGVQGALAVPEATPPSAPAAEGGPSPAEPAASTVAVAPPRPAAPTAPEPAATPPDEALAALQDERFVTLLTAGGPEPGRLVLEAIRHARARLLVVAQQDRTGAADEGGDLAASMLKDAPCDTLLLRAGPNSGQRCARVLVPSAGGPHAKVALRLAAGMAGQQETEVVPLYVEPAAGVEAEALDVGRHTLERILKQAGVEYPQPRITPHVVLADKPLAGISRAAQDGDFDLVLVGATQEGFVRRLLFGTVPDRLLAGPRGMAVAVMRSARPLEERALAFLEALVGRWVPQLERADRLVLFERLQEGSRFGFDFAALITLATGIAALGLIQDSAATVIGAMLVAPLMTPIIGAGLALVQGNTVLVSEAGRAIAKGLSLAVGIGAVMGFLGQVSGLLPEHQLTAQLEARGAPTVLDLVVAYLSGVAAAYALARPSLSGALPGVAIAAALVPPLATVGIAASQAAWAVSRGAALLFGTNLVAIMLGAATVFWSMGVSANRNSPAGGVWVRRAAVGLVLALLALGVWFVSHLPVWVAGERAEPIALTPRLRAALEQEISRRQGVSLLALWTSSDETALELLVRFEPGAPLPADLAQRLSALAASQAGHPVRVAVTGIEAGRQVSPAR